MSNWRSSVGGLEDEERCARLDFWMNKLLAQRPLPAEVDEGTSGLECTVMVRSSRLRSEKCMSLSVSRTISTIRRRISRLVETDKFSVKLCSSCLQRR
jgi:hypothetical protein